MRRLALALSLSLLPLLGCSSDEGQVYDQGDPMNHADDEHVEAHADHAAVGPHGGAVIELTADHSLHGELVVGGDDPARGRFYLLGEDMKTVVPAERVAIFFDDPETGAENNIELAEVGGDGNADSAVWSFRRDLLPGDDDDLAGEIKVVVDGQEYEAAFDTGHHEGDHDHAGHDHDDHDHGDDHAGHDDDHDH